MSEHDRRIERIEDFDGIALETDGAGRVVAVRVSRDWVKRALDRIEQRAYPSDCAESLRHDRTEWS